MLNNVKMYLWLKLYTVPFFVSGQTYKISNNYCSHCNIKYKNWQTSKENKEQADLNPKLMRDNEKQVRPDRKEV